MYGAEIHVIWRADVSWSVCPGESCAVSSKQAKAATPWRVPPVLLLGCGMGKSDPGEANCKPQGKLFEPLGLPVCARLVGCLQWAVCKRNAGSTCAAPSWRFLCEQAGRQGVWRLQLQADAAGLTSVQRTVCWEEGAGTKQLQLLALIGVISTVRRWHGHSSGCRQLQCQHSLVSTSH